MRHSGEVLFVGRKEQRKTKKITKEDGASEKNKSKE
jgi:ribosome-associated protein YbcJ (S4-like RNA binding protein)